MNFLFNGLCFEFGFRLGKLDLILSIFFFEFLFLSLIPLKFCIVKIYYINNIFWFYQIIIWILYFCLIWIQLRFWVGLNIFFWFFKFILLKYIIFLSSYIINKNVSKLFLCSQMVFAYVSLQQHQLELIFFSYFFWIVEYCFDFNETLQINTLLYKYYYLNFLDF